MSRTVPAPDLAHLDAPLIGVTAAYEHGGAPNGSSFHLDLTYTSAIREGNGIPVLVPILSEADGPAVAERLDGLVLSGGGALRASLFGPDDPRPSLEATNPGRFRFERALVRAAVDAGVPILGICRGHQTLSEALGGTLLRNISLDVPGALAHWPETGSGEAWHDVELRPGTRLHTIVGDSHCRVNSLHRQAVGEPPPGFVVAAWAPDGVAEAIENTSAAFLVGVQFHPERLLVADRRWRALFAALVEVARERRMTTDAR